MPRPLWLLNTLLIALSIGLAAALARSIMSPAPVATQRTPSSGGRAPSSRSTASESTAYQLNSRRPPLSDFESILRGNLFKDPDEDAKKKQLARSPAPPPPLPKLQGTIFLGKNAKAILKQGNREELYNIGDPVAGGTLTEIDVDRVVIDFGHRRAEVMLKSAVRNVPPPSAVKSHHGTGSAESKFNAVARARMPQKHSNPEEPTQPAFNSPRMRRAQEIIERHQQLEGGRQ